MKKWNMRDQDVTEKALKKVCISGRKKQNFGEHIFYTIHELKEKSII